MIPQIDTAVLHSLAASRIDLATHFFLILSTIGETAVMLAVTILVAAYLYFYLKDRPIAYGLLTTMVTSTVITYLLKHIVNRARPDAMYQAYMETGGSFPSGHSSAAAAFCGFFVYVALSRMSPGPRRTAMIVIAVLYPILMAFGRIYLGVHYLSDVVAGLAVGAFAAWMGSIVLLRFDQRTTDSLNQSPHAV